MTSSWLHFDHDDSTLCKILRTSFICSRTSLLPLPQFLSLHDSWQSLLFAFVLFLSLDGVVSAGCASQIFRNAFARNQETNSKQFLRVVQLCISEKRSGALSAIVKVRHSTSNFSFFYWQGNELSIVEVFQLFMSRKFYNRSFNAVL